MLPAQPPQRHVLDGVLVELDVTPRWFQFQAGTPAAYEDASDIWRTVGLHEGLARQIVVDIQIGVSGVRLVLPMPPGNATDGFAREREAIVGLLNALDAAHPRRARITAAKVAVEKKAAEEQAAAAETRRVEAELAAAASRAVTVKALAAPGPVDLDRVHAAAVEAGEEDTSTLLASCAVEIQRLRDEAAAREATPAAATEQPAQAPAA